MRIAYLTGHYPRATDTFIQREIAEMRFLGEEIYTFSIRRPGDEHLVGSEQVSEFNNTFYILPPHPIYFLWAHLSLLFTSPSNYFQALKLAWLTQQPGWRGLIYQLFYFAEAGILAHQIKTKQIEHLHNHLADSSCTVAMLAAQLGGFTFSFTMHGPYIFFEPYRWRIDEKIKRALFVACISYYCRSQGMIFAPVEKWNQMYVIHCGIDPSLFDLVSHKPERNLLYVGRLAVVKGLPILLQSLASLKLSYPDILLTVVGDGSDRLQLEEMSAKLGLNSNIKFVGYKSQEEVRKYLQQTDIFVMSSFAEGIPVVLMEAMAAGLPVVATQIAGISELVEDGVNGYLVPPGDVITLTNRIEKLLIDNQRRIKFGLAGRKKVETNFNIHYEVSKLHNIITSAIHLIDRNNVYISNKETTTSQI